MNNEYSDKHGEKELLSSVMLYRLGMGMAADA